MKHRITRIFSFISDIDVIIIDADLTEEQLASVQTDIFTNPVTQISSYRPLPVEFDWCVWVGYKPGVRDNPGSTAVEAIEDLLGVIFQKGEAVYTSKRFCIKAKSLAREDLGKMAGDLLANHIIQQWKIYHRDDWDNNNGIGHVIPKVMLNHLPCVETIAIESDVAFQKISDNRGLALNHKDIPVILLFEN